MRQPQQETPATPCRREADSSGSRTLLAEQINLLRVVDNKRYPAFFEWRGRRHVLQVESFNKDDFA